ncbi:MAG: hypothetical protein JNJ69_08485 [Leptospiraceae bacterium]|nr:hypothetical protein [Leptospiraceae bacterium]
MAKRKPLTGMPCEEFTTLASHGLEGKISWWDRLRMLWHKIECVYCRRFVQQLQRIRSLLAQEKSDEKMPEPMKEKIRKRFEG